MVERFLEVQDCEKKEGEDICKVILCVLEKNITLILADAEDRAVIMAEICQSVGAKETTGIQRQRNTSPWTQNRLPFGCL